MHSVARCELFHLTLGQRNKIKMMIITHLLIMVSASAVLKKKSKDVTLENLRIHVDFALPVYLWGFMASTRTWHSLSMGGWLN